MTVIEGLSNLNFSPRGPVVCVGNFDGVHVGHQALFRKVMERALAIGGRSVAITFDPHPVRVLNPAGGPPLLTVKPRKEELIAEMGLDYLINVQFTRQFAALSARDFVNKILIRKIRLKELVIGYDQAFGAGRQGGVEFIQEAGREMGFPVHVVGPVMIDGEAASSTRARQMIQDGQVQEVVPILGRPYQISGRVVKGHDRGGRILGFPTANLRLINEVVPAKGVYAVKAEMEGGPALMGVTNVGHNPTFGGQDLSVETFILDFEKDLYGQFVRLNFMARLRDEMKFESFKELAAQIGRDVELARKVLA